MFDKLLARQLAHPNGVAGKMIGRLMEKGNACMNGFVLDCLGAKADEHVSEVGFGSGWVLDALLHDIGCQRVDGVEISDTMLRKARHRFKRELSNGRLSLHHAGADRLPREVAQIDCICSVNTVYFWPDALAGLREFHRVTKPGGRLALGFRPAETMRELPFTRHGFRIYKNDQIAELLHVAGFRDIQLSRNPEGHLGSLCATAVRH